MNASFTKAIVLAAAIGYVNIQAETEPNESLTQASVLALNAADSGSIAVGEVDWYSITPTVDGMLTVNVTPPGTGYTCVQMVLYEQDGTREIMGNGWCGYSNWKDNVIGYNLAPATYYLKVTHPSTGGGPYRLTTLFTAETAPNDAEPNDFTGQALTLGVNSSASGHLGYLYGGRVRDSIGFTNGKRDNIDWYKVTLTQNGHFRVRISDDTTLCTQVVLRASADTTIDIKGNGWCGYSNYLKYLEYPNLAPGTYYIGCLDASYANNTNYGFYTVTCSLITPTRPADTGNNDGSSGALPLSVNSTVTGHLGYWFGDVKDTIALSNGKRDNIDWWSIKMDTLGSLKVSVTADSTLCTNLSLFGSGDTLTPLDNNGWCGYSNFRPYVEYTHLAPGTYLLSVTDPSWKNNTKYGAYALACSLRVPSARCDKESNNTLSTAIPLVSNDSITGFLGFVSGNVADTFAWNNGKRDNADWYSFVLAKRSLFSVKSASDNTICIGMTLFSGADTVNAFKTNGSCGVSNYTDIIKDSLNAGTWYLQVYDPSWKYNTRYGAYSLVVQGLAGVAVENPGSFTEKVLSEKTGFSFDKRAITYFTAASNLPGTYHMKVFSTQGKLLSHVTATSARGRVSAPRPAGTGCCTVVISLETPGSVSRTIAVKKVMFVR